MFKNSKVISNRALGPLLCKRSREGEALDVAVQMFDNNNLRDAAF